MGDGRRVVLERSEAQRSVAVEDFNRLRLGRSVGTTVESLVAALQVLRVTGSGRPRTVFEFLRKRPFNVDSPALSGFSAARSVDRRAMCYWPTMRTRLPTLEGCHAWTSPLRCSPGSAYMTLTATLSTT